MSMKSASQCKSNPPHIFFVINGKSYINQGCCNSWECPRCGTIRAKEEYRKIIYGSEKMAEMGHKLYFVTLTCRGKELSLNAAEGGYYKWTTRLLNACRYHSRKHKSHWAYCQVTERQKRQHPHSHIITTYLPKDAIAVTKTAKNGKQREIMYSEWFIRRNVSAGLGSQCEITEVKSAKGVASYIAKYLFKDAIKTKWPKGWRRIRYSRSWPREEKTIIDDGWPLMSKGDWYRVKQRQVKVTVNSISVYADAKNNGIERLDLIEPQFENLQ